MARAKRQYTPMSNFLQLLEGYLTFQVADKLDSVPYFRKKFVETGKKLGYKASGKMLAHQSGDAANRRSHPIMWKTGQANWVRNHGPYRIREWIVSELSSFEDGEFLSSQPEEQIHVEDGLDDLYDRIIHLLETLEN